MLLLLLACAPLKPDAETVALAPAHTTHLIEGDPDRPLTVEVWYPTTDDAEPAPIAEAFLGSPQREDYDALLDDAPEGCPSTTSLATEDAPLAPGSWPVVVLSHCHQCVRFSNMTIAQSLAQAGFVVVAPDHAGNTLFETGLPLDKETLKLRRADLGHALDALLNGDLGLPASALDDGLIGALGHSFGSVSVGLLAQEDGRIGAAMGVAAPMDNPLLPGVSIEALELPLMFLLAEEDNSITEAGNILIRNNYDDAPGPAWLVEVPDVGHWSFSDVCGLTEDFMAGCGEDARQTDPDEAFAYSDPEESRMFAASLAVAFFEETLLGEQGKIDAVLP
jgi:predicted dienelactone hydrolase